MRFLRALAMTAGLILVSFIGGWWWIGDQTEVPLADHPDYEMVPPDIPAELETAAGIAAAVIGLAVVAGLLWANLQRRVSPKWWFAIVPALVTGWLLAISYRTMTAGVIGANIGAGFVVVIFLPFALILTVVSVVLATRYGRLVGKHRVHDEPPLPLGQR